MAISINTAPYTPDTFLPIRVSEAQIAKAEKIRYDRDQKYGNIFIEQSSDMRWCGDLGELIVMDWFKAKGVRGVWHMNNAAGKADFTISERRIDTKTVKRKYAPQSDYTAQITAQHKDAPVDDLFFCIYEFQAKTMWLLGGIEKARFLQNARFYGPGEQVHHSYTVREKHGILNAPTSILTPPLEWIKQIS